jgi:hypothetical protein
MNVKLKEFYNCPVVVDNQMLYDNVDEKNT